MYVIKKKESFTDTLKLESTSGENVEINFTLNLNPQNIKEYRKLYLELADAQKQAQTDKTEAALEQVGKCVVGVFKLIFGEENTEKILTFYAGNYAEMLMDIFPYIQNVVAPQMKLAVKEMRQNVKRRFGKTI